MQLTITARNMEATEPLKDYAREKILKIEKYLHKINSVHMILTVEKYRHIAEVTVHTHGFTLKGQEETGDMYSSIDKVMDKIEKQAKKVKDKLTGKIKAAAQETSAPAPAGPATGAGEAPRVVRMNSMQAKPMTLEEAAMQFRLRDDQFMVFTNAKTNKVNVLYRRSDGDFGLIEST